MNKHSTLFGCWTQLYMGLFDGTLSNLSVTTNPKHSSMVSQTDSPDNAVVLYNAKGGTGKTTVGINVAGALNEQGNNVLFVDLDPQGNATEGLGLVEEYNAQPPNLFDVLIDPDHRETIGELIHSHSEFDVVPSNVDMLNAERELTIADYQGEDAFGNLSRALETIAADYDVILIDSPPFFGELSDSALYAAQNVLIPALTESTSQWAVELLLDQIERLEDEQGISIQELGAVANRIETTNEAEEMQEWLEMAFPEVPVFHIRKRVTLQRAFTAGESIFEYDKSNDMAAVFLEIADALERQLTTAEMNPANA